MFRLIKLAVYCLAGYCIYQFYLGIKAEEQGTRAGGARARAGGGALGSRERPAQQGGGRRARVEDASGHMSNYNVGRGVISR